MKISLVIPMYNEGSIIEDAVKTFSEFLASAFEDWELIFVEINIDLFDAFLMPLKFFLAFINIIPGSVNTIVFVRTVVDTHREFRCSWSIKGHLNWREKAILSLLPM